MTESRTSDTAIMEELSPKLRVEKIMGKGYIVDDIGYSECPRYLVYVSVIRKFWIFAFKHVIAGISYCNEIWLYDEEYLDETRELAKALGCKLTLDY